MRGCAACGAGDPGAKREEVLGQLGFLVHLELAVQQHQPEGQPLQGVDLAPQHPASSLRAAAPGRPAPR
jgi:hypothetical protein